MLSTKNQQLIKFIFMCVASLLGIYFYTGTLEYAIGSYIVFVFMSKVANLGYHRWLSHNLIEPGKGARLFILWCMVSSALVKPFAYVVGHRLHHKYSDTEKDPHHTGLGFWNCLLGNFNSVQNLSIPVKDILRKKDVMFVDKYYYQLYFINLIFFWFIDPNIVFLSFILLNLRMWINVTVFNYIAHGGKNGKEPVNLPTWTAYVLGYTGEQLHKNHHDDPSSSNFGKISMFNFDILYHIYKRFVNVKN